jgi:hypothetical protein
MSSSEENLASSADHAASHYVVFSGLQLLPPSFSSTLFLNTLSLCPSLHTGDQVPRSCTIPSKTVALYILVLMFLDNKGKKVMSSRYRPGVAQRVPGGLGSQIFMTLVRLSASRIGRLYPQEMFLVLIFIRGWVDPRAMVRSEVNMSLKKTVTPTGIDPGTVRPVFQRLNHYATPGPSLDNKEEDKNYSGPNCSHHSPSLICC